MPSFMNSYDITNNDNNKMTAESTAKAQHSHSKKLFLTNLPAPYGSIPPKRNNKKGSSSSNKSHSKKNNLPITKKCSRNNSISSAPYPFISSMTPTSSSFLSIFSTLFDDKKKKEDEKPVVGFMPRTATNEMSQLVVDVASSPIECFYYGNSSSSDVGEHQQDLSLSSSSSSSESSLSSIFSFYVEDDNIRNSVRNNNGCKNTSIILSDILCDHYVQTQMNNPPSSSEAIMDVPLETFRMFEAPSNTTTANSADITESTTPAYDYWMTLADEQQSRKEWTLIEETKQLKQQQQPKEEQEEKQQEEKKKEEKQQKEQPNLPAQHHHIRDTRANAAYLRMIVAEVNMMRSQKIVGPLRPRRVLPKRSDPFLYRPSPLVVTVTA